MLSLRRCLADKVGNEMAKLFHLEMKDIIRQGLNVIEKLPVPGTGIEPLEFPISQVLVDSRNEMLSHIQHPRNQKIVENVYNGLILLCEADEAWRLMIYQALKDLQGRELPKELEPRSEYWR